MTMRTVSPRGYQRGVSLVIALIALVAMTLAGLALMRSVDTTNLISGNLAFRQSALNATDVGVETALVTLNTIVTTSIKSKFSIGACCCKCNEFFIPGITCSYCMAYSLVAIYTITYAVG